MGSRFGQLASKSEGEKKVVTTPETPSPAAISAITPVDVNTSIRNDVSTSIRQQQHVDASERRDPHLYVEIIRLMLAQKADGANSTLRITTKQMVRMKTILIGLFSKGYTMDQNEMCRTALEYLMLEHEQNGDDSILTAIAEHRYKVINGIANDGDR